MSSFLVTGASRSIGLHLVAQLASQPASRVSKVFAAARSQSDALAAIISGSQGRVEGVELEVTSRESVAAALATVETALEGTALDVLVNNAGIMPSTSRGIRQMTDLEEVLEVNMLGVNNTTKAFLPLLDRTNVKRIINVSTTLGSIATSALYKKRPNPAYKISKAALNVLTVQYSVDLEGAGFTVLAICPGVKTDLGTEDMHLLVEDSVKRILKNVDKADIQQSGKFFTVDVPGTVLYGRELYNGSERPW